MKQNRIWIALAAGLGLAGMGMASPVLSAPQISLAPSMAASRLDDPAPAEDKATADARTAIEALIAKANDAAAKKDVDGTVANMTDDFVGVDSKGKSSTKAEVKDGLAKVYALADTVKAVTTVQKVALADDQATVTVAEHVVITIKAPDGGKSTTLDITDTDEDTWVKTDDTWHMKKGKTLTSQTLVDGKPEADTKPADDAKPAQ